MALRKGEELEVEGGSVRWHTVENSLSERLLTCRKTNCRINDRQYRAVAQAVIHGLSPWRQGLDSGL
jgi:hypothetical protein